MTSYPDELAFLKQVCLEAGDIMLAQYGNITEWKTKTTRGDIVTAVDHAVEDLVRTRLELNFPTHNLLSEECGWVGDDRSNPTWILDPLDGTRNFALAIPTFATSLAMVIDAEPVIGAIYDPVHKDMYWAEKGNGAFLNRTPLSIAQQPTLDEAMISVSWSPVRTDEADIKLFADIMGSVARHTTWFRRIGSAAMVCAYIASGKWDAYIQGGIQPWDIAAGMLLITEAGGTVSEFDGSPMDLFAKDINMLAANPAIHRQMLDDILTPLLTG